MEANPPIGGLASIEVVAQGMTPRAKTILVVLVAITLAGVGYFFIFKTKKQVQPPVNTAPKAEEIDTSDWQTYRNEKLGFEIKMPKDWSGGYYLGRFIPDDPDFWQEQVGGARFNGPFRVSSSPQFNVRVKDSDLTLEEFARKVGVSKGENILINNLSAKKAQGEDVEAVLIKGDKRYYYFEFVVSVNNSINDFILWNKIISTFKPLD